MEKVKKYLMPSLFWFASFLIYIILLVVLNFTGILHLSSITKINYVVISLMTLIFGISTGKKTSKKGYLEGIKHGGIIVAILFLLNLIFYRKFSLYLVLYYLIVIASSTIGSMIGINLKR